MASDVFAARVDPTANHVAIRVRDLGKALRFYSELIGLPVQRTQGAASDPEVVWLPGLQLIRQSDAGDTGPAGGFDHLALGIENIEEACARLDAAGFTAETSLRRRSRDEVGRELMMAFYRDPEGNKVELLKYLEP